MKHKWAVCVAIGVIAAAAAVVAVTRWFGMGFTESVLYALHLGLIAGMGIVFAAAAVGTRNGPEQQGERQGKDGPPDRMQPEQPGTVGGRNGSAGQPLFGSPSGNGAGEQLCRFYHVLYAGGSPGRRILG